MTPLQRFRREEAAREFTWNLGERLLLRCMALLRDLDPADGPATLVELLAAIRIALDLQGQALRSWDEAVRRYAGGGAK